MKNIKKGFSITLILAVIMLFTGCSLVSELQEAMVTVQPTRTAVRRQSPPPPLTPTRFKATFSPRPTGTIPKSYPFISGYRLHGGGQQYVEGYDTFVSQDQIYSFLMVEANGATKPVYQVEKNAGRLVIYPLLSRDGKKVVFTDAALLPESENHYTGQIKIYDTDTDSVNDPGLTADSQPQHPLKYFWRPDGKLYIGAADSKLYMYDPATGEKQVLFEQCLDPEISPDLRLVVFSTIDPGSGSQETFIHNFNTGVTEKMFSKAPPAPGVLTNHYFLDNYFIAYTAKNTLGKSYAAVFNIVSKTEDGVAEGAYDVCVDDTGRGRLMFYMDVEGVPKVFSYNFEASRVYEVPELKSPYQVIR